MKKRAFTLIELLSVIAVIAIIGSMIFPIIGYAQRLMKRKTTQLQFIEYVTAIEAFHEFYGYYPDFGSEGVRQSGVFKLKGNGEAFVKTLQGSYDGKKASYGGNIQGISFIEKILSSKETLLSDSFGNDNIIVVMDMDEDGWLNDDFLETPIRARVIVYTNPSLEEKKLLGFECIKSWEV